MNCQQCGKEIPPRAGRKTCNKGRKFCCKPCYWKNIKGSAFGVQQKRKPRFCKHCGKETTHLPKVGSGSKRTVCDDCLLPRFTRDINDTLKKDVSKGVIKLHAKVVLDQTHKPKICVICGYNLHVERCHIKAISSFPTNTRLGIINSPDNLIYCCPNHHWELDHGILPKETLYGNKNN